MAHGTSWDHAKQLGGLWRCGMLWAMLSKQDGVPAPHFFLDASMQAPRPVMQRRYDLRCAVEDHNDAVSMSRCHSAERRAVIRRVQHPHFPQICPRAMARALIRNAIEMGAPLYNAGHSAYRHMPTSYESSLHDTGAYTIGWPSCDVRQNLRGREAMELSSLRALGT